MESHSEIFDGISSFIENAEYGQEITRQQLIDKLSIRGSRSAIERMDNLRNMFAGVGCLKTVGRGVYVVICRRRYARYIDLKNDYNNRLPF